jgi:hypothetical protein
MPHLMTVVRMDPKQIVDLRIDVHKLLARNDLLNDDTGRDMLALLDYIIKVQRDNDKQLDELGWADHEYPDA